MLGPVIPQSMQLSMMALVHDARSGGHMGRDKMLQIMKAAMYWETMSQDIRWYITTCGLCQRMKAPNKSKAFHKAHRMATRGIN